MKKTILFFSILMLAFTGINAQATDSTAQSTMGQTNFLGNWDITMLGLPQGDVKCQLLLNEKDGKLAVKANCVNMRIVIFEGDIFHSIEESKIPDEVKTWRISYVFKLIVNPKEKNQNVKAAFLEMAQSAAPGTESLLLGPDSRA